MHDSGPSMYWHKYQRQFLPGCPGSEGNHARPRARARALFFSLKSSIKNRQSHFYPPTPLFLDPFMTLEHIKNISGPLSQLIVEILRVSGSSVRTLSQRISAYFDGFTLIFSTCIDQFLKSWSRFEGLMDIFTI